MPAAAAAAGVHAQEPGERAKTDSDEGVSLVLAVDDNLTDYAWELPFGRMRRLAVECRDAGEKDKALAAAKMQFLLCPPFHKDALDRSIESVCEMLAEADGNDARAKAFRVYAKEGPAGADGKRGTGDDLASPIAAVSLDALDLKASSHGDSDEEMYARIALAPEYDRAWHEASMAFARLERAEFDEAARMLTETLSRQARLAEPPEGDTRSYRWTKMMKRIETGLGVVYRAKTGTAAGLAEFVESCKTYAKYGPAGQDYSEGTEDDLRAPMVEIESSSAAAQ
jgi:hypothetical protein